MSQFSEIPHQDLTILDVCEEYEQRINRLDYTQIQTEHEFDLAANRVLDELLSELEDIWK